VSESQAATLSARPPASFGARHKPLECLRRALSIAHDEIAQPQFSQAPLMPQ
jgi:hypothetical protein